ncbi:MAG: hypothetical protein JXO22_15435 [Phycisphaerae bacterium]|nr:hypothetical protein [Phycisphaerae bacterium]
MFVLLEHTKPAETSPDAAVHWDFLVEVVGLELLPTWRLAANPLAARGPIHATRIQDHRRRFLAYEGELTAGLGSVRCVDRGMAEVVSYGDETVTAQLTGTRLIGVYEIVRDTAGELVWRRRA